jgi:hypothetical protein
MTGTSFSLPFSSPFGSGFSFVPSPSGTPLALLSLNPPSRHSDGIDRLIDPITLNYVRTENGEWAETADNRTTVLIALSIRVGESAFDPDQGTSFGRRRQNGQGLSPEVLQAEIVRVGEDLARAGILSELAVAVRDQDGLPLRDDAGRLVAQLQWRDLSSGSPATATFAPR